MADVGDRAPAFTLQDHLGRKFSSEDQLGKRHILLLFYPLDFTPTWSGELPALDALLSDFRDAHTQPVGISVDSHFSHAAFAAAIGGISYPLLADFHPKGAVAKSLGLYIEGGGITDRATVIIDADGVIRHKSSVTPAGRRDMSDLLAAAREIDAAYAGDLPAMDGAKGGLPADATLYVKNSCMFSRWALYARANLHLEDRLPVRNVSEDADALAALTAKGGKGQAPALDLGDRVMYESGDINAFLTETCGLP